MNIHEINEQNYQKAVLWSKHADSRASIILAFNAALVALLVTDNPYTHDFVASFHHSSHGISGMQELGIILFGIFLLMFTLSSATALNVLMLDVRRTRCEHNNAFAFMNIAELSRADYRETLLHMDDQKTLHALQDQTHLTAQLARRKIAGLHLAWAFLGGTISCAVSFVVLTIFSV